MAFAEQAAHGPGGGAAEGGHGACLTRQHAAPRRLSAHGYKPAGVNAYRYVYLTVGAGHGVRGTSSARPGMRGSRGRPRSFPYPLARRAAAPRCLSAHGYKPAGVDRIPLCVSYSGGGAWRLRRKQRTAREAGLPREATEVPLPAGTPRRSAAPPQRAWLQACRGGPHTVVCILQWGRGMPRFAVCLAVCSGLRLSKSIQATYLVRPTCTDSIYILSPAPGNCVGHIAAREAQRRCLMYAVCLWLT